MYLYARLHPFQQANYQWNENNVKNAHIFGDYYCNRLNNFAKLQGSLGQPYIVKEMPWNQFE